jgi:hypothetical protein
MKRFFLCLLILPLAGCGTRYLRPNDLHSRDDERECMYQAYKANRWEDRAFVDRCMEGKGYAVNSDAGGKMMFMPGMLDTFREYDAKRPS